MALHDRELGERIARARAERGWKQKQLAAAVDVETTAVSRWERGANDPPLDKLVAVAHVLKTPVSYFVAHLDGPASTNGGGEDEAVSTRLERRVEEVWALLQEVQRELRVDPNS